MYIKFLFVYALGAKKSLPVVIYDKMHSANISFGHFKMHPLNNDKFPSLPDKLHHARLSAESKLAVP